MGIVAVVGAGLAGLTAGFRLAQRGYRVTVFERHPEVGGLARAFSVGGEPLETTYHHIFSSDSALVALADEVGLGDSIEWLPSSVGIFSGGRTWAFGGPLALLRFGPLSLWDKLRFGLATLYLQRVRQGGRFERVTAADWVRTHQGRAIWDTVWGPLFEQKFAAAAERVAMVWLWGKMRTRGTSRSGLGERLGYMRGSFARLPQVLAERIVALDGTLSLGDPVVGIEPAAGGLEVVSRSRRLACDAVVVATPIPDYLEIAAGLLPDAEQTRLRQLRATGALCAVLELDRQLTPYYWLNIADQSMPFGGVIEHTNLIPANRYGDRHVLYISKYHFTDDPRYHQSRDQILDSYLAGLGRINPSFDPSWVLASHLFRAAYAQPVVTVGYRDLIPDFRTPVPGLYLTSMAQVYPEDRGMNYAIAYGNRVSQVVQQDSQPVQPA